MNMRIAIIGGSAKAEHFTGQDYDEVWGLNAIFSPFVKRWHRRFHLHKYAYVARALPDQLGKVTDFHIANQFVPLYTIDQWPGLANCIPLEFWFTVKNCREDYHCCSIDWMIAYAIWLGVKSIALHGINQTSANEPISSRACVEYWCGVAEGSGIKVITKPDVHLFSWMHIVESRGRYGFDDLTMLEDLR